ncbi:MAG TPA: ABC transporter substrate-binding protein [Pseudonocardiaceae bacterium]
MTLRRLALAAVGAVLALVAAPAATPAVAQTQQQPVVLRVAVTQNIDTLNPFTAIFATSTEIGRLMYEFLTTYDEKLQPAPGLAERWEVSPDKLTWTFTIREGAKWSDGQPITARDAAFTFNLMLRDPAARKANGNFVAGFESVTATDDRTLVIKTKQPQATMLALDVPIVPEHVWSKVTDIASYPNDQGEVVGSGPFVLVEHAKEQYVKLKANKNYWRGAPQIDELHFITYKNTDAAVQALRKGEVDLVSKLTSAQFDALKNQENIALNQAQGRRFYELAFNPGAALADGTPIGDGHPALKDVRVRQAIAQAIDRQAIVDRVMGGYAEVGAGYIPPVFADYHWKPSPEQEWKFDLAAANRLLDEAGYPKGPDGVRVGPDGKPLQFRLYGRNDRGADARAGEFIKSWLAEIGITVDLQLMAGTKMNEEIGLGNFDMAFSSWGVNPDPDYVLSLQTCDQRPSAQGASGNTDSFFCDARYDELYRQQLAETDRTKRIELVKQAQERFYEQVGAVILFYENALEAYRSDRFSSFQVQPDPGGVITAQQGYWGYYGAVPTDRATTVESRSTVPVVAVVGGVILVGAAVALVTIRRRRANADDRE